MQITNKLQTILVYMYR